MQETQETWVQSLGLEDPLEGRAWHPSPVLLPGESSWREEPGGLQSMELWRVRYALGTEHAHCLFLFFKYLFIWLCWVLNVALRISHSSLWTLSCGMWDLVPWPGIEPGLPALGVWSLSLWATREAPLAVFRHECRLPSYIVAQCNRMQLCSTGENHRNPTEIKLSVQIFHFTFHVRNDSALVSLQHHLQLWKLREEEQERNSISCHWKA